MAFEILTPRSVSRALVDGDRNAPSTGRNLASAAVVLTLLAVCGSLAPFGFKPAAPAEAVTQFRGVLRGPLSVTLRADFAANVLFFIPLGFSWLGAMSFGALRLKSALIAIPIVGLCLAFSVGIEFLQCWFPPRNPSLGDILAQGLGAAAGCTLWLAAGDLAIAWLDSLVNEASSAERLKKCLLAYSVGYVLYCLLPFDLTLSLTELYHKYRAGKVVLIPFTYPFASWFDAVYSFVRDVVFLVPVGALAAISVLPRGRRVHGWARSIAQGMVFVAAVEAGQLFVISRYTDATDLVSGLIGVLIGAALMRRHMGSPTSESGRRLGCSAKAWTAAAAILAVAIVLGFWRPYNFAVDATTKQRVDNFTSLQHMPIFWSTELHAVSEVLLKTIPFAALGACLVMAISRATDSATARKALSIAALAFCCGLGLGVELGQILLSTHVAHVTDAMMFCLGSVVGVTMASATRAWSDRAHPELHPGT